MATIKVSVTDANQAQLIACTAQERAERGRRERLDAQVSRILLEDADRDLSIIAEFSSAMADGLE